MKLLFILLSVSLFVAANASKEEEGDEFEGDIILTSEQQMLINEDKDLAFEGAMQRGASKSRRWPNGVVPYTIDSSLASYSRAKNVIASAMKEWSQKTCITFKKRTTERGYIKFRKGSGCSSYVGRTGAQQSINLASGCWYHGIVVHEIGHALGFWHEQSRPDRDNYVTIMWNNIREKNKHNFKKHSDSRIDSLGVPYDYGSIMHYGARSFSVNGKNTIEPKKTGVRIGQRSGLSPLDVKQMKLMYKCSGSGGGTPTQGPTQGPTHRPTQRPTQGPTQGPTCRDNWASCPRYKKYCKSNQYVKKNCKKTCDICGGGSTQAPTQAPTQVSTQAPCIDRWSKCAKYTKYCASSGYMKRNCRKTCKIC